MGLPYEYTPLVYQVVYKMGRESVIRQWDGKIATVFDLDKEIFNLTLCSWETGFKQNTGQAGGFAIFMILWGNKQYPECMPGVEYGHDAYWELLNRYGQKWLHTDSPNDKLEFEDVLRRWRRDYPNRVNFCASELVGLK